MDLIEAIIKRKSIRDYKRDSIPQEVLKEILEVASRAPSAVNAQPWEFAVLTGTVLEKVKQVNIKMLKSGAPHTPDFYLPDVPRETVYQRRAVELAKQLFKLMDISREDREKRRQWMERGYRFFDAPAAILVMTDRLLTEALPFLDIGAVMQTICLVALDYGLGTCIEDQGIQFPDEVRKIANIPESKLIMIAMAIGYPNWGFPANKIESSRESIKNMTIWCGFE